MQFPECNHTVIGICLTVKLYRDAEFSSAMTTTYALPSGISTTK